MMPRERKQNERGATLVEYLVVLISMVGAFTALAQALDTEGRNRANASHKVVEKMAPCGANIDEERCW